MSRPFGADHFGARINLLQNANRGSTRLVTRAIGYEDNTNTVSARDELATILRSLDEKTYAPDVAVVDRILGLVGKDRTLASFTIDVVTELIAEHERTHPMDASHSCDRCEALAELVRDLESVR